MWVDDEFKDPESPDPRTARPCYVCRVERIKNGVFSFFWGFFYDELGGSLLT